MLTFGSIPIQDFGLIPMITMNDTQSLIQGLADHLDKDIGQENTNFEQLQTLVNDLDGDVSPLVSSVLETLVATIDDLHERVTELEADLERTHEVATTAVGDAATNDQRLDDLEAQQETTREVAMSAIAKAQQLEADADQQEDAEQLPEGIEPSSSPLDFFANCRQSKVKTMFVERSNRQNTSGRSHRRNDDYGSCKAGTDRSDRVLDEDRPPRLAVELGKEENDVKLTGGTLRSRTRALVGPTAESFVERTKLRFSRWI